MSDVPVEEIIRSVEANKLVTPDSNVILDDWAYRVLLKTLKADADKLAKVRILRHEKASCALMAERLPDKWKQQVYQSFVDDLDAILDGTFGTQLADGLTQILEQQS